MPPGLLDFFPGVRINLEAIPEEMRSIEQQSDHETETDMPPSTISGKPTMNEA